MCVCVCVTGIRTKTFFMEIALFCSSRRVKEKNIKGKNHAKCNEKYIALG